NRHTRQTVFDGEHQQNDQQEADIDENKLQVGDVGQMEKLVERHAAFFGSSSKLKAEKGGRRGRNTAWSAGEGQPVVEDKADNFPESEGHNRQIIAVHTQNRKPQ